MRSDGYEAGSGGEDHEFIDLVNSIKERGQDDPVEVVPLDGENKGKYALVSGSRRLRAIAKLVSEGITMAPVKALVLADRDQSSLFERNLVENIGREDVSAADTSFALGRLKGSRKEDGTFTTDSALFARGAIPQGYGSKLLTIFDRLHPDVFKFWRIAKSPLPYNSVYEIAKMPPDQHKAAYEKMQEQKAGTKGKPGPKDPLEKAKAQLRKLADQLYLLASLGAISVDKLKIEDIILDVCPHLEEQKGKKGKKVVDAACKSFKDRWSELQTRADADGGTDDDDDDDDDAPKGRSGKRSN